MPARKFRPAILLGNGLNNINNSYTWKKLIEDLIIRAGLTGKVEPRDKPFPLLYEEIYAKAIKSGKIRENDLKKFISDKTTKIEVNDLHTEILKIGIADFLTTNYDSVLEKVIGTQNEVNISLVKELNYSIFRCKQLDNYKIWHIHGEENNPLSITLGYEHYSGYLQRMRNYATAGLQYTNRIFNSLEQNLQKGILDERSWIDLFFTRNIYIVGLSLDFIEMHLWWLLTFRSRLIDTKKIQVKNRIVYYYAKENQEKIQNRIDLFESCKVVTVGITNRNNWSNHYLSIFKKIKNEIG